MSTPIKKKFYKVFKNYSPRFFLIPLFEFILSDTGKRYLSVYIDVDWILFRVFVSDQFNLMKKRLCCCAYLGSA